MSRTYTYNGVVYQNLIPLCEACHNEQHPDKRITSEKETFHKRRTLVTIPPVKKETDFCCRKGNGARGMDKTDSRAHVMGWYIWQMKESRKLKKSRDQNRTKRSKKDLRDQLEANGTYGKFFEDMIADYMAMYVTKTLLIADIQKRGTIVEYNNGGGQSGYKKNEAVDMFNKTNAQMLKLLSELGAESKRHDRWWRF